MACVIYTTEPEGSVTESRFARLAAYIAVADRGAAGEKETHDSSTYSTIPISEVRRFIKRPTGVMS